MRKIDKRRPGAALVEFAVLLPLLLFLFAIGVDFARIYYHHLTITNCARCGAMYGSKDDLRAADTEAIKKAALADAKNLSPEPTVATATATDSEGHPCLRVTVTWTFNSASGLPFIPTAMTISRMVEMRIAPNLPKDS